MKTLFLIALILSMLIYSYKIYGWIRGSILLIRDDHKTKEFLNGIGITKRAYIWGGIEHLLIFGCLLTATIIIFL